jgi:4-amino-4-deoxy-L-arabinose transferase-like glycosyltransferase
MLPRLSLPLSKTMLALLAVVFVGPGLLSHDPWKSLDAITIEIAHQMAVTGDWLVPRLAGEPWMSQAPLYPWVGALLGTLLGPFIPFHGAVRLASALFMLAALACAYFAARGWYGTEAAQSGDPEARRAPAVSAMLLLIGSVGLFVHAHEATPELATLAAVAGFLAASPHAISAPLRAGLGAGLALGATLLGTGPAVTVALFVALVATWLVSPEWRNARGALFLIVSALVAAALAAAWLVPLAMRDASLLEQWWREAVVPEGGLIENLRYYLVTLSWSSFPSWLFIPWTLWMRRRRLRAASVFLPLSTIIALYIGLAVVGPARELYAILMLPALALLAAPGALTLRRGAAAAFDWYGVMTFSLFVVLVWVGYCALIFGVPRKLAENALRMAPGFVEHFDPIVIASALLLSLAWLMFLFRVPRSRTRGVTRWAAGMTLLWGTFATLYMPWADHQKSYRSVALQLKSQIPVNTPCVTGRSLGSAQRAAFSYLVDLVTVPYDPTRPQLCPLLLVQGRAQDPSDYLGPHWKKLADVGRPGDRSERFRLYHLIQ